MNVLIKNAHLVNPGGDHDGERADISIQNGHIAAIGPDIAAQENDVVVARDGLCVSPGWFDASVSFGEPGYEERETLAHGLWVAARSGFCAIALQPSANPVTDNQAQVSMLRSRAQDQPTDLYPIGALTKNSRSESLAELLDMQRAGAVGFGDYRKYLSDANLMKIAMQYVSDIDGLLIGFSQDETLRGKGIANEGDTATRLGLKGIPNLAEEIAILRNLGLLTYTDSRLLIPTISTKEGVEKIREAKRKGLRVMASVSVNHLLLNDEALLDFDTNRKLTPPLRAESDRLALLEGVMDGTIDAICSDHFPLDIEHKKLEFDLATDGSIGLESCFGALCTVLPVEVIVEKLTSAYGIFGLEKPLIQKGARACLTLFETDTVRQFNASDIRSSSANAALLGQTLKGQALGIYNNHKLIYNER